MTRILLISFFLVHTFLSFSYKITVNIKGLENQSCRLAFYYADKQLLRDSVQLDGKGVGVLKSDEKLDKGVYLMVAPNNLFFEFLVNEDQDFTIISDTTHLIEKLEFKKADEQTIAFANYIKFLGGVNKRVSEITQTEDGGRKELTDADKVKIKGIEQEVKAKKAEIFKKYPNAFITDVIKSTEEVKVPESIPQEVKWVYYRDHYFDYINFAEEGMLRTPVFHKKLMHYLDKLNYQVPDSIIKACDVVIAKAEANKDMYRFVVSRLTNKYAHSKIMGMDAVFNHIGEKYYIEKNAWWADSAVVAKIREKVVKSKYNLIGNRAIPFAMEDPSGVKHNLFDVEAELTVLVFWSSSCGHCKKTMPLIKELYDEYRDREVEVVAVNIDKKKEDWIKYLNEHKDYDWLNLADGQNTTNFRVFYNVDSTPIIYLLDNRKYILAKRIDVETLEKMLEEQLN